MGKKNKKNNNQIAKEIYHGEINWEKIREDSRVRWQLWIAEQSKQEQQVDELTGL